MFSSGLGKGIFLVFVPLIQLAFCDGNADAVRDNEAHDFEIDHSDELKVLQGLVNTVQKRIAFGKDVAIYKWVNGEPILDKVREKAVMDSVAQMAKNLGKPFGEDEYLFFIDLMEATKLIEYALVSEWFTRNPGKKLNHNVSLLETRTKISAMQADIINAVSNLQHLKHAEYCQEALAKAISKSGPKNMLSRVALQRAFGNFCKTLKGHNEVKH